MDYRIRRDESKYVVSARYRRPTPEFRPTIEIDHRSCETRVVLWE
jgi:hypothetical protein